MPKNACSSSVRNSFSGAIDGRPSGERSPSKLGDRTSNTSSTNADQPQRVIRRNTGLATHVAEQPTRLPILAPHHAPPSDQTEGITKTQQTRGFSAAC
jgi:hypothetical protein